MGLHLRLDGACAVIVEEVLWVDLVCVIDGDASVLCGGPKRSDLTDDAIIRDAPVFRSLQDHGARAVARVNRRLTKVAYKSISNKNNN